VLLFKTGNIISKFEHQPNKFQGLWISH